MVYIVFFGIIILFLLIGLDYRVSLKVYTRIPLIFMASIMGFRYQTGSDLYNYEKAYNMIKNRVEMDYELVYQVIVRVVDFFHLNFQALLLIHAILSFFFLYLAMKNICKDKMDVAVFISFFYAFMFTTYFTIMRQFLSAAIITYVFSKDYKKNVYKEQEWNKSVLREEKQTISSRVNPVLLLIIACLSHTGVIIAIPICILFRSKILRSNTTKLIILILALIIDISGFSVSIIERLVGYFAKYLYYTGKTNFGYSEGIAITIFFISVLYVIMLVFSIVKKEKYSETDKIIDMVGATLTIYFATMSIGWFHRAYWYSYIFAAFIPCWFRRKFSKINGKIDIGWILIVFSLIYGVYFYLTLQTTQPNMFPYNFRINIFE